MTDLDLVPEPPKSPPKPGVLVLGRFQPFHLGHEYMLESAAKWRDENLPDANLINVDDDKKDK